MSEALDFHSAEEVLDNQRVGGRLVQVVSRGENVHQPGLLPAPVSHELRKANQGVLEIRPDEYTSIQERCFHSPQCLEVFS